MKIYMQINFESFDKLTMGDTEFAHDLLTIYVKELGDYLKEIDEFLSTKDLPKFRLRNHDLRTIIKTLGLEQVVEMQEKLKSLVVRNATPDQSTAQGEELKMYIKEAIEVLKVRLG